MPDIYRQSLKAFSPWSSAQEVTARRPVVLWLMLALFAACDDTGSSRPTPDSGVSDAAALDGGSMDVGLLDRGPMADAEGLVDMDPTLDARVDAALPEMPDASEVDQMVDQMVEALEVCPAEGEIPILNVDEPVPIRLEASMGRHGPFEGVCDLRTPRAEGTEALFRFQPGPGWWLIRVQGPAGSVPVLYARADCARPSTQLACRSGSGFPDGDTRQRLAFATGAEAVTLIVDRSNASEAAFEGTVTASRYVPPRIERAAAYRIEGTDSLDVSAILQRGTARASTIDYQVLAEDGMLLEDWDDLMSNRAVMAQPRFTLSTPLSVAPGAHRLRLRLRNIDGVDSELVDVPLAPTPISPTGGPCDPEYLFQRCPQRDTCDWATRTCVAATAPIVESAIVHQDGRQAFFVGVARDPDGDVVRFDLSLINAARERVQAQIVPAPRFPRTGDDLRVEGRLDLAGFDLDAVRAEVVAADREGLRSEPFVVDVTPRPRVAEGEACELAELTNVCSEALQCAEPDSVCLPREVECPEQWPVRPITDDDRVDDGWLLDVSTLEQTVDGLAHACEGGGPAAILRFEVPSTAHYFFEFVDPPEALARPQLRARLACAAPQTTDWCGLTDFGRPYQQGDVIFLFVDGLNGWSGEARLRIAQRRI